ncbi:MAG: flagellar M-ring protein FliF [Ruminiclostridium sp.]|nr:flagellar M-ring protein FliF [Ruminiclostridium sp.]
MPESLVKLWRQTAEFWQSLDKSQKTRLYITSIVIAVVLGVGIFVLAKPNLIILINSDDQKQISEMSKVLTENKIWNTLDDSGTGILVNSRDKSRARLSLNSNGLPKEGTTFADAISMIGISTTESDKKQIWRNQQISEIESNIKMLDNVEEATVNLAVPESSIFITDGEKAPEPQAIVTVKSRKKLTPAQVQGIVLIVSRSVEKLDQKNVSVVDGNTGIALNDNISDDMLNAVNTQEEMRVSRENEIKHKVLEQLGYDSSDSFDSLTVTANVVLDFDKEKTQSKILSNPDGMDGGALISSETQDEKVKNGTAGGEPGLQTNPGTTSYPVGSGENSDYANKTSKTNYAYDEIVKDQEKATGKMVPKESSLAISLWYGKKVADDTKLDEAFINGIIQTASTATGIPSSNIAVNKLKMAPDEIVVKTLNDSIRQLVSDYGFFALMLLLIVGMLIMAIPRRKKEIQTDMGQAIAAAAGPGGPKFVIPESIEPIPEIELEERSEIKKQIDKFVKQKPDSVAQLLRNWLSDEWDG